MRQSKHWNAKVARRIRVIISYSLKPKAKMSLGSIYTVGHANDKNMQGVLWYDD